MNVYRGTAIAMRLLVTDAARVAIDPGSLPSNKAGSPPESIDCLFIEAVLFIARAGVP
jgi:hypothetical protein